jgi:hypothetical protein
MGVERKDEVYGLGIVVADLCRCGCSVLRVHPYSVKSEIPIWKCLWCRKRRGRPTELELKLMKSWLREYGWTMEPLAFCEDGGIRFAHEVLGRDRGPVAWLDEGSKTDSAA